MTSDKLTQALVDMLDANKPDPSITVADARSGEEIELPIISVDCSDPEPHSLAMPGVNKIQVAIIFRANLADKSRSVCRGWLDSIEQLINQPEIVRDYITASGNGIQCDYIHLPTFGTRWDESTFEAESRGESFVVRSA